MISIYSERNDANNSTRYESQGVYDTEKKKTIIKNIYSISVENLVALNVKIFCCKDKR